MASPDHTSPTHPDTAPADRPTNPLGRPVYLSDDVADTEQRLLTRLAGIQMAINVLNDLLANSEAFRDQQASGHDAPTGEWPLPPTYVEGLFVAVHFLSEYAESLSLRALSDAEQAAAY